MSDYGLIVYLGLAAAYAALATGLVFGAVRLAGILMPHRQRGSVLPRRQRGSVLPQQRRAAVLPQQRAAVLPQQRRAARPPARTVALIFFCLFFVFLALHPFPDPSGLDCTAGGPPPRLRPFAFLGAFRLLWQRGAPPGDWMHNLTVASSVMNFALCAVIGAVLARHRGGFGRALVFAVLFSGGIETAQVTGLFGLYPCAWRQFDVDDLILNIAGIAAGFLALRLTFRPAARPG